MEIKKRYQRLGDKSSDDSALKREQHIRKSEGRYEKKERSYSLGQGKSFFSDREESEGDEAEYERYQIVPYAEEIAKEGVYGIAYRASFFRGGHAEEDDGDDRDNPSDRVKCLPGYELNSGQLIHGKFVFPGSP